MVFQQHLCTLLHALIGYKTKWPKNAYFCVMLRSLRDMFSSVETEKVLGLKLSHEMWWDMKFFEILDNSLISTWMFMWTTKVTIPQVVLGHYECFPRTLTKPVKWSPSSIPWDEKKDYILVALQINDSELSTKCSLWSNVHAWKQAMNKETKSARTSQFWNLVDLLHGRKDIEMNSQG